MPRPSRFIESQPCNAAKLWRVMATALLLSLLLVIAACEQKQTASPPTGVSFKTYHGTGVVEAIDREEGTVKINHEEIKDYMEAMTMDFYVRHTGLLNGIEPGDKVDFMLEDAANVVVMTEIKKR